MAFKFGSMTGSNQFTDFFDILHGFITGTDGHADAGMSGQDWTILLGPQETTNNNGDIIGYGDPKPQEVIYQNIGLSGNDQIIIGIRAIRSVTSDVFNWNLNVYLSYTPATLWNSNNGDHGQTAYGSNNYTNHPTMLFADQDFNYWIFSNKQRIIVIIYVSGKYHGMYLGFGNRFADPGDYPNPLLAIGSVSGWRRYDTTEGRFIVAPRNNLSTMKYAAWIVGPANIYHFAYQTPDIIKFLPYHEWNNISILHKVKTTNDILLNSVYIINDTRDESYMSLDAAYHIASSDIQSEDTIQKIGNIMDEKITATYDTWIYIGHTILTNFRLTDDPGDTSITDEAITGILSTPVALVNQDVVGNTVVVATVAIPDNPLVENIDYSVNYLDGTITALKSTAVGSLLVDYDWELTTLYTISIDYELDTAKGLLKVLSTGSIGSSDPLLMSYDFQDDYIIFHNVMYNTYYEFMAIQKK